MLLVMQALDNSIALRAKKRWFGRGYRISTEQNRDKPNPTYIDIGNKAAQWLAQHTGGIAQSNVLEALGNIPTTAHVLGGAVIGVGASSGVVDQQLRVFGYQNLLVCDGAAIPANPGVNPALTIAAIAEYAMDQIPLPESKPIGGSRKNRAKLARSDQLESVGIQAPNAPSN